MPVTPLRFTCAKTVSKLHLFEPLRLLFERKQVPQIVVIVRIRRKTMGPLEPIPVPWAHTLGLTVAVKLSNPSCEPFVGVLVERVARNLSGEPNWAVKGVKFGKSEREQCNSALTVIIERLRREFEIAD